MYRLIKAVKRTDFFDVLFVQSSCTAVQTAGTTTRLTGTMLPFQLTDELFNRATGNKLRNRKCDQHDAK